MRSVGRRAALLGLATVGLGSLVQYALPAHGGARIRRIGSTLMNSTTRVAKEIVDARCGALFHVGELRDRGGAIRLAELGHWRSLLGRTRLHPLKDVERAFVTSRTVADTSNCALLLDVRTSDPAVLDDELLRIGERIPTEGDRVVVAVELDGVAYAVGRVGPSTIAAVPVEKVSELARFKGEASLPEATDGEAVGIFADDPSVSLAALCPFPSTLSALEIDLAFGDAGATIDLVATSTSNEQAIEDAKVLGATITKMLEVDLFLFEVHLLGPIKSVANGNKVEMFASLGRAELDLLLAIGSL